MRLRLLLFKQNRSRLFTPISNCMEIAFPYATIAAATATAGWLFRWIAEKDISLCKLCAEVSNPLPGLISIVG